MKSPFGRKKEEPTISDEELARAETIVKEELDRHEEEILNYFSGTPTEPPKERDIKMNAARSTKTFNEFCEDIIKMHDVKQSNYSVSPIDELPVPVWLAQIQIKATRAKYANSTEKLTEELIDTAVYCLLLLEKLEYTPYDPKTA